MGLEDKTLLLHGVYNLPHQALGVDTVNMVLLSIMRWTVFNVYEVPLDDGC